MVVSRKDDFCAHIERLAHRVQTAMQARLHRAEGRLRMLDLRPRVRMRLSSQERRFQALRLKLETFDVRRRFGALRARLAAGDGRLDAAVLRQQHAAAARLGRVAARLDTLSPLAVLGRGYAVVWNADRTAILRDANTVAPGERVHVKLERGTLDCDVIDRSDN
jgi:exodeoxyribonuclease VII large subunit